MSRPLFGCTLLVLGAACGSGVTPPEDEPPAGPSDLQIVRVGDWEWRLDWTDNAQNESGFRVYYTFDGNGPWLLSSLPADSTTQRVGVPGIAPSTTYEFSVYAFDERTDAESEASANASLTTPPPAVIEISPSRVEFEYTKGGALPPPQSVTVTNGRPEISLIGLTLTTGDGMALPPWFQWLDLTLHSSVAPTMVELSVLGSVECCVESGVYTSRVPVYSPVAATVYIDVSLIIRPN